ncbi:ATP-binding protein [Hymenobacter sp. BRD67]|uniref:HAMP domain-containing sensor histidine kinase n=1 Tax=Hymenobacter sp. BRD67 TaxID=2675877 RepID=UPI001566FED7|nr:ATP-binding protein [Hymenobacter sp. BRD67]QKG52431.1 PAS domain-containing protein [Hymenobacter sp. BRD67]
MRLQAKITLGFLAMLGLLLGIAFYAFATLGRLDRSNRAVLQDNFYSVQLGQGMLEAIDALEAGPTSSALGRLRSLLGREAGNITEPGERRLVDSLTQTLDRYPGPAPAASQLQLRQLTHRMVALNMAALTRKNAQAMHTAAQAKDYLLLFSVLSTLVGLMLVGSVPQAAVGGLRKLAASLDYATRTNFAATVPIESTDEVGQLTAAFNRLLVHVQDTRTHSLADLVTERNRTSGLVQTLSEPLFLLAPSRRVLVANPAACTLLGLPESQVLGRPATELAAASALFNELLAPVLLPVAQRPASPVALALPAPDGTPAYYQLSVHEAVAFNEARDQMEAIGTVLALRNVSAFRQLDQTKSNFLATVSHELKTPLSSINFNLKLLHDPRVGSLNAEQQELVGTIKEENQRLLHIVGELLTVARLGVGESIALDRRPTAIAALVAAATTPLQLQLRARHLTLQTQLPADLPPVQADLEKTAWVLLNLLVNAVRYSPEQGQICLSAAPTSDHRAVRIQVQDHGPGIASEDQQRIFERFTQGPSALTGSPGTGLGLSISREFITSQGGELGVESSLGQGSTFFFTLPVAE